MRTLLLDGDVLCYISACRSQKTYDWGEGITSSGGDADHSRRELVKWVGELQEKLEADDVLVALGNKPYFREKLWPEYKLNRTHGDVPDVLSDVRRCIQDSFPCRILPTLEADDVLGILATEQYEGERVVVSTDKDLLQLPGLHANPRHPAAGIEHIGQWEADLHFYTQAVAGDPTDNFPGCRGIGPKKAVRMFRQAREEWLLECVAPFDEQTEGYVTPEWVIWRAIVNAYANTGKDEAFALNQARVARILRACDYDFNKKEPILWTPSAKPGDSGVPCVPPESLAC